MNRFSRVAENRIVEAIREGKFRNLRGEGKPINPSALEPDDSGWWAAHHILKQAGLRPVWIELDLEIRRLRAVAIDNLDRNGGRGATGARKRRAEQEFRREVEQVNQLIDQLNAAAPAELFKRPKVNPERILSERGFGR